MGSLIVLGITLLLSLAALPFWLIEKEREKEQHARMLEAARAENARYQEEMAHQAWRMQQAAEQQRSMQPGQGADGQHGPPQRWS
jgi:hypothetical protein